MDLKDLLMGVGVSLVASFLYDYLKSGTSISSVSDTIESLQTIESYFE